MKNIIIEGGEKMKYENVDRLLQGLVDKEITVYICFSYGFYVQASIIYNVNDSIRTRIVNHG